jgi:hypothetical protein
MDLAKVIEAYTSMGFDEASILLAQETCTTPDEMIDFLTNTPKKAPPEEPNPGPVMPEKPDSSNPVLVLKVEEKDEENIKISEDDQRNLYESSSTIPIISIPSQEPEKEEIKIISEKPEKSFEESKEINKLETSVKEKNELCMFQSNPKIPVFSLSNDFKSSGKLKVLSKSSLLISQSLKLPKTNFDVLRIDELNQEKNLNRFHYYRRGIEDQESSKNESKRKKMSMIVSQDHNWFLKSQEL